MSVRPPSGLQHRISAGASSAVVTEVGATLRALSLSGREVLDGFAEDRMCTGYRGVPLLPWPNRIEDGRYTFRGADHQLPIDRVGENNAIHGLTAWQPWRLIRRGEAEVTLGLGLTPRPGYPFSLELSITYALAANELGVTISAANIGRDPAPFGAGHHPYFLPRAALDAARITVPARSYMLSDARGLPQKEVPVDGTPLDLRRGRVIGTLQLDHCFGDLDRGQDGRAWIELDDIAVWAGAECRWLQLYSGDKLPPDERRRSIAIEPMTCPPNAFRTGRDLKVLDPGERTILEWGVRIR